MNKLFSKVPTALILFLFFVASCSEKETAETTGFTVIGQIKNSGEVKQVSIQELTTNGLTQLDTAAIDANGNFTLTGTLTEKTFCILRFQKGDIVLVVDSNSHLKVTIDAQDIGKYTVENSKENEELRQLYLINDSFMRKSSEVNQRFSVYSEANLTEAVQLEIRTAFDSLQIAHKNAVKTYIGSLSHSIIPYFASTFLLPEPDLAFLQSLDETLFTEFSNSKYAIQLHE